MGLAELPKSKWSQGDKQPILLQDWIDLEGAVLETLAVLGGPGLEWVDATAVKVPATLGSPARVLMCGFPNVLSPGQFVHDGLCDGKYRENTGDASVDFDISGTFWGSETANTWYAVYAVAADGASQFNLKAMPFVRVKEDSGNALTLGKHIAPNQNCAYYFATDELVGGRIYVLLGSARGEMREITANQESGGVETITYAGNSLGLSQGDWVAILPPNTNFRLVGAFFNNSSSHIDEFTQRRQVVMWATPKNLTTAAEAAAAAPPIAGLQYVGDKQTITVNEITYEFYLFNIEISALYMTDRLCYGYVCPGMI